MNIMWAPWRIEYIDSPPPSGCIFCPGDDGKSDREKLVLYRTSLSSVMLNRYPYTNGHLLVFPLRHLADLDGLSSEEMTDLFGLVRLSCSILRTAAKPEGFNIGVNMGKAAGAGVEGHVHVHIVPRWNGDTNFMTVVGDLRVMPENLISTYDRLLPQFSAAG